MYKLFIVFLFLATSCSKTNYTISYSKSKDCTKKFPYRVKEGSTEIGCATCKKALTEELNKVYGGKHIIIFNRVYNLKN